MTSLLDAAALAVPGRLAPTDVRCRAGEMIAVIGPNGAGKTSLLRALAGIEPQAGRVSICGDEIASASPARRVRLLSFLPAARGLVWPISVRDVIALGLPSADPKRVQQLVELLELQALAERPVNQLSTGERSRVLLARALAARPRLLLLDEPLANLDPYWVLRVLEILRETVTLERCVTLVSVHDLAHVPSFDRVLLVAGGRVVADGKAADVLGSEDLARAFRIERDGAAWRVRTEVSPSADPRSSP